MSIYHQFFFGVYPYICLAIFILGTVIRYDHEPYTWKASSSLLLADKGLRIGNVVFHLGVLLILAGHFVGLLTPHSIYTHFISAQHKQILAMVVGGVAGTLTFTGLTVLCLRRMLVPEIRATSLFSDILIVVLLWVQVTLGLITIPISLSHHDAGLMLALSNWVQGVLTFQPGVANYLVGVPWPFQMHLILGQTLFLLFPFTRLVHLISAPIRYVWRPYQVVRSRRSRR